MLVSRGPAVNCHGRDCVQGNVLEDHIGSVADIATLVNNDTVSNQLLVSDAHVDGIVPHVSPKDTLVRFANDVVGFGRLVSGIFNGYLVVLESFVSFHRGYGLKSTLSFSYPLFASLLRQLVGLLNLYQQATHHTQRQL